MNHVRISYRTAAYHLVLGPQYSLDTAESLLSFPCIVSLMKVCLSLDCEPRKARNDVFAVHLFIFSI